MADFDDDPPEHAPPREGKSPRRRGRLSFGRSRASENEGSTGEVARDAEPPMPEDFGFEDYSSESAPPPKASGKRSGKRRSSGSGSGRSRGGGRGRGGSGRGGATGGAAVLQQPATRLALGLVLAGILILVIVLVVRDCQRNQLVDSYETYMSDVATLTAESATQGEQMRTIINNQDNQTPAELAQQVRTLGEQADALADRAGGLEPPGALNSANGSLRTTLEYRVTGLNSLADAIPQAAESNDGNFAGSAIAAPMQRFLSSDVIYDDSFVGPAQQALQDDDISGIEVPEPAARVPATTPKTGRSAVPS
jgi:hypothetical protein